MLFMRRRGLYIRILLLIPLTWLMVTLIFSYNERSNKTNGHQPQSLVEPQQPLRDSEKRSQQLEEKKPPVIKPPGVAHKRHNLDRNRVSRK